MTDESWIPTREDLEEFTRSPWSQEAADSLHEELLAIIQRVEPRGYQGPVITDAEGVPIVNATPLRGNNSEVYRYWGSLVWALGAISCAAQDGGISSYSTVVEIARRLRPWLLAAGWTPPPGDAVEGCPKGHPYVWKLPEDQTDPGLIWWCKICGEDKP